MWAEGEKKVPLYHKISAANERGPGQPPEEQVSVYVNRATSKYLVGSLKSPTRCCSKTDLQGKSVLSSVAIGKYRQRGLREEKSESVVIKASPFLQE